MRVSEDTKDDDGAASSGPVIYVCTTCRRKGEPEDGPRPGLLLAEATAHAAKDTEVSVAPIECLGNCSRSLSAAMRANGSWTYVFGSLDEASDAEALIEGVRLLASAENGILPWRGRPEILKRGLIARIPPLSFIPPSFPPSKETTE